MNALNVQKSHPIQIGHPTRARIILAGCGGTGSFLALHLARLAYHARPRGLDLRLLFVDPDVVEEKNLGRQNFCHAEVGIPKAEALATRYAAAFGLPIEFYRAAFDTREHTYLNRLQAGAEFRLVAGCVDNAAARESIADAVGWHNGGLWWLDCGNHEHAGQVVLGNTIGVRTPVISPLGFCTALPAPSEQHPELLQAPALDGEPAAGASCAELLAADAQSLMINQAIAGWAATYVTRLLLARDLDLMATYVDLVTGSARSERIISPEIPGEEEQPDEN